MTEVKSKNTKFDDVSKVKFIVVLLVLILAISFSIPSLARYKNHINLEAMFNEIETWDGSIATSYKSGSGTIDDPYIISNASEFAYFGQELKSTDYAGTYFKLSNSIVLNNGLFGYDLNNITYKLNDTLFYLDEYSGNVYDNKELTGNIISTINVFESIASFRGYFDGNYNTIYGLYLTSETEEVALFNEIFGKVENLYFKNTLVYGGSSSAILANDVSYSEINNISTDGIVVGKGSIYNNALTFNMDDVIIAKNSNNYSTTIRLDMLEGYSFDSIIVKGLYSSTESNQTITINNKSISVGEFEITLSGDSTSLAVNAKDKYRSTITLSDLVIEGIYNYPISSGFVGRSNDSNFNNVINKAIVYGTNVSGLLGIASNISLSNAYNLGSLNGDNVSGIIGLVTNNSSSVIRKVYNNGVLTGTNTNFINKVINSNELIISDSFNTQSLTRTFNQVSGNVSVLNLYDVNSVSVNSGELTGEVNIVSKSDITKDLLVNSLGFLEYVDDEYLATNSNNIWIYEYEEYPILYVDELNNPVASLNIGVYSWNDLGYDLRTLKFTESKAFNITPLNGFNNFKNIYYYIHDGQDILNRSQIEAISEWIEYEDIVSLDSEGFYTVYIRIELQDGHTYYINSDLLFFDLYGPNVKLSLGSDTWNSYNASLDSMYINDTVSLNVEVNDLYSDILRTDYYVSNVLLTKEELNNVSDWITYDSEIVLSSKGTSVVYVRGIDTNNHETIINSDYIIYGGYSETLSIGEDTKLVSSAYITDKSSIIYRFTYDEDIVFANGYNSNLVFSNKLPVGTLITMIDYKLNNIYSYSVSSDDTLLIPLSNFKMVGKSVIVPFDEGAYLATDSKDVSFKIDFSKAIIDNDFNFNMYIDLRDEIGNVVLSTLRDTIKDIKVYSNLSSELTIVNKSIIYGINYDSDSTNVIDFEYSFNALVRDNNVVSDTKYQGMKTGIAIKLVDSNGNIVEKNYLKNMEFIVNNNHYFADSDGIVRINMANNLDKVVGSLTIITHANDLELTKGDYSLVIVPFVALDGRYTDTYFDSVISIAVVSDYEEILDYNFNVSMDNESKILVKDSGNAMIPFEIISTNQFSNPNIRVSLYKKESLTAYDQNYLLIDLNDYTSNELELASNYSYYVNTNRLELNLDLTNMDKTGYEIRFELFDGDKRIDLIKKKFIVR